MSRVPIEERHHIVVLCKEGVSQREIAGRTRRPLSTVNRIIQAYRDENRLADAVRAPRSRVTDENDDLRIVGAASDDAFQSSSEIRKELGLLVSTKTIQRRLREAGLHSPIAAQKPLLTARRKQQRLAFAQDHEAWESCWDQVAFSDESTFSTRWDQQSGSWRPCHTRHNPEYVQHVAASGRCAVNVWGVLTRQGLGPLVRIDGTLTSRAYAEIIDQVLLPYILGGPFPDGASADCLWEAVLREWEHLKSTTIADALYASMPQRMSEVVSARGEFTRY
ncbi:hypothetical protein HPB47_017305 [Ixodes persulcatus]|uniref:Uncharacterized protein n=1 Tax=Ixodes persulcatus TaxID=34615 RepID=A0AC60QPK0_IXOPE|nr:hypothetical protein HPB47_017305 [Ixodes persulcatus]